MTRKKKGTAQPSEQKPLCAVCGRVARIGNLCRWHDKKLNGHFYAQRQRAVDDAIQQLDLGVNP